MRGAFLIFAPITGNVWKLCNHSQTITVLNSFNFIRTCTNSFFWDHTLQKT
jgi:hypothetical protein